MSIKVSCDECFQDFLVGDTLAGKRIKCKHCQAVIAVPKAAKRPARDEEDENDEEEEEAPASRSRKSAGRGGKKAAAKGGSAKWILPVVGGVCVLACCGGVGAIYVTMRNTVSNVVDAAAPGFPGGPAGTASSAWSVEPDPFPVAPRSPAKWNLPEVSIQNEKLLFPSTGEPVALIGGGSYNVQGAKVWDVLSGKSGADLTPDLGQVSKIRLSPDGKRIACQILKPGAPLKIVVLATDTNKTLSEVTVDDATMHIQWFDFLAGDELAAHSFGTQGGNFVHRFRVFNALTGAKLRELNGKYNLTEDESALSPGRKFLAVSGTGTEPLRLINMQKLTEAGQLTLAQGMQVVGTAFSADGRSLAVLETDHTNSKIAVYNTADGKRTAEHAMFGNLQITLRGSTYKGSRIAWFPDGKSWLLFGVLAVDAASGKPVWRYVNPGEKYPSAPKLPLAGNSVLLLSGERSDGRLKAVALPQADINASLAAMAAGKGIYQKGRKVKFDIQASELRFGTEAATRADIETILGQRLKGDGLTVGEDGTLTLQVRYSEGAGEKMSLRKSTGRFNPLDPGQDTGQSVTTTTAHVELALQSADGKVHWSQTIDQNPSMLSFRGDPTDESARNAMFDMLKLDLAAIDLPYFIPEDDSLKPLPVVTEGEGR